MRRARSLQVAIGMSARVRLTLITLRAFSIRYGRVSTRHRALNLPRDRLFFFSFLSLFFFANYAPMLELAGSPAASKARYDVPTLPLHPPPPPSPRIIS